MKPIKLVLISFHISLFNKKNDWIELSYVNTVLFSSSNIHIVNSIYFFVLSDNLITIVLKTYYKTIYPLFQHKNKLYEKNISGEHENNSKTVLSWILKW